GVSGRRRSRGGVRALAGDAPRSRGRIFVWARACAERTRPVSAASLALLESLTQADAVPGHEAEVRAILRSRLASIGEIGHDRLGSVFCTKRGTAESPRILLDSHLDEVGFVVHGVTPAGMVKFLPLGNWWAHALLAQRVRITTARGKVLGVIGS